MKRRILCYGDSNTWGYDAATGQRFDETIRYPKVLQELLGDGYEIIEEGCSGRTTVYDTDVDIYVNGYSYLYPCLESHSPLDLVVLMLGTNDLNNGVHKNAYYAAAGAERLINLIRHWSIDKARPCPKILLVSPILIEQAYTDPYLAAVIDYPWAAAESRKFRQYFAAVAEKTGCAFFAAEDCAEPCAIDGIHLGVQGHRALAEALQREVYRLIDGRNMQ